MIKLMKLKEVIEVTKLGRASIYAYVKRGMFPRPVRIGVRAVAWKADEVQAWISERQSA